jgi:hypothetical protein
MTRDQAIELLRKHAKAKPESYYAEPFMPHEWAIDAVMAAPLWDFACSASEAEEWRLVPVEPTTEMCLADWNVSMSAAHSDTGVSACAWAAMLAAAPRAPIRLPPEDMGLYWRMVFLLTELHDSEVLSEQQCAKYLGTDLLSWRIESEKPIPAAYACADEVAGKPVCSRWCGQPDKCLSTSAETVHTELTEVAKLAWRALCDAEAVLRTMVGDDTTESDKLEELHGRVTACAGNLFAVLALPVSALSRSPA